MFGAVLDFLSTNVGLAFDFLESILTGGVGLIYNSVDTSLTQLGEIILLTSLIGLGMWGLNFIISMIPFTKMGKR